VPCRDSATIACARIDDPTSRRGFGLGWPAATAGHGQLAGQDHLLAVAGPTACPPGGSAPRWSAQGELLHLLGGVVWRLRQVSGCDCTRRRGAGRTRPEIICRKPRAWPTRAVGWRCLRARSRCLANIRWRGVWRGEGSRVKLDPIRSAAGQAAIQRLHRLGCQLALHSRDARISPARTWNDNPVPPA